MRFRSLSALGLALAAALPAVGLSGGTAPQPDDVGTIETSMVEMLHSSDISNPLPLASLRQLVANSSEKTSAGTGVDVAVIDTGVSPVSGLDRDGKVLHGPDLSFEGASPATAYLDTYGHGTHMAGIIAGERNNAPGIAPGARIVSLKVAGNDGVTTVPQVVAAIDWVVEHRNTDGLNIRVLNLSLGQAGVSTHVGDALSAAAERAWKAGIIVVVAAGNRGETQGHLDSPAVDPFVISVGATDVTEKKNYWGRKYHDYSIPSWSATGDGVRNPDVVAPGRSIGSYRVPGSTVDQAMPSARLGNDLFLGSGTSQAAAVAAGVAAAIVQYHPEYTPDQVKATLQQWSRDVDGWNQKKDGVGRYEAANAVVNGQRFWAPQQLFTTAAGAASGLIEPTGATWSGGGWTGATWSGATWSGTVWSGATWSGATWSGATWSGATWSGATWSGATWSGATWSSAGWIFS